MTALLHARRAPEQASLTSTVQRVSAPIVLAVVVLLRGGLTVFGPRAAEVAGNVYRELSEQHYFSSTPASNQVVSLGLENCCRGE